MCWSGRTAVGVRRTSRRAADEVGDQDPTEAAWGEGPVENLLSQTPAATVQLPRLRPTSNWLALYSGQMDSRYPFVACLTLCYDLVELLASVGIGVKVFADDTKVYVTVTI